MNNKVSQKLEIIGFKESVKKYTTIYFFIYFLYYIYVLPVFSVDEISPNKTEDHHCFNILAISNRTAHNITATAIWQTYIISAPSKVKV